MFDYIEKIFDEYGHGLIVKSMYGLKVEPDPNRERRVRAVIESMGDKYLLAKPIERKTDGGP
jgi:hypothetical protein